MTERGESSGDLEPTSLGHLFDAFDTFLPPDGDPPMGMNPEFAIGTFLKGLKETTTLDDNERWRLAHGIIGPAVAVGRDAKGPVVLDQLTGVAQIDIAGALIRLASDPTTSALDEEDRQAVRARGAKVIAEQIDTATWSREYALRFKAALGLQD